MGMMAHLIHSQSQHQINSEIRIHPMRLLLITVTCYPSHHVQMSHKQARNTSKFLNNYSSEISMSKIKVIIK